MLIEPGDSIQIIFDGVNTQFSGKGSEKLKFKWNEDKVRSYGLGRRNQEIGLELYCNFLNAQVNSALRHLEQYKGKISNTAFTILQADCIGYLEYKKMQALVDDFTQEAIDEERKILYRKLITHKSKQLILTEDIFNSLYYILYLSQKTIVEFIIEKEKMEYNQRGIYEKIVNSYASPIQDAVCLQFLRQEIEISELSVDLDWCIRDFIGKTKNGEYKNYINVKYEMTKNLAPGKPAYNFLLQDINGKQVSLTDFRGKLLYVDFWASWCKPCRAEFRKAAPDLKEKLKDFKDIIFLYISMDDNKIAWKKAVKQDKIEGVHLIADNGMEGNLAKYYVVGAIPRYLIIGRDGKIVNNNAKRPSDEVTYYALINSKN